MFKEIGSEFWIDEVHIANEIGVPKWLLKLGNISLTASGRGAISLMLEQINPKYKTVLLPSYICESVILPFISKGYKCFFYNINLDLSPNIENINKHKDIGIFLHMGYFGFQTNVNLENTIKKLRFAGTVVVEDVTHTLFSSREYCKMNDFYIGSIRKWFGVPNGGFLASKQKSISGPKNNRSKVTTLRLEALLEKAEFIKIQDDKLKKGFLDKFNKAEEVLNIDIKPYKLDDISVGLINKLDTDNLINIRRGNFEELLNGLKLIEFLKPVFKGLQKGVCPLFFPVFIENKRNEIRNELNKNKIYCPIHWPIPSIVGDKSNQIYSSILSLPCDQRYGTSDMKRIISVLEDLEV